MRTRFTATWRARLDRLWTYTVGLALIFVAAPLWILIWYERHPLLGLVQFLIMGVVIVRPLWREGRAELRRQRGDNPLRDVRYAPRTP